MYKKELFSICTFYAISPVHAGSGASTSAVDLPIQRERHTNWPIIQSTGVKGALRDHYRKFAEGEQGESINVFFGSDSDNDKGKEGYKENLPSAVSASDAMLLAFPMRSNIAPFVWVTCPAVLKRMKTNFECAGFESFGDPPLLSEYKAISLCGINAGRVILEDMVVTVEKTDAGGFVLPDMFKSLERLLLVSDEAFDYCVTSCTEIQTQIKISSETGTASDGALRYQELLPSDTFLYSVVSYSKSERYNKQASQIQNEIEAVISGYIQIGGDETLGRGICKITWIPGIKA